MCMCVCPPLLSPARDCIPYISAVYRGIRLLIFALNLIITKTKI